MRINSSNNAESDWIFISHGIRIDGCRDPHIQEGGRTIHEYLDQSHHLQPNFFIKKHIMKLDLI